MSSTTVACLKDVSPFSGQSIFGIQIGGDTSNNFALTFSGLAVRAPDGRLYAFDAANTAQPLQDVTGLELQMSSKFVYRIPVNTVKRGDIIVTSDSPFAILFVTDVVKDGIKGIDPFEQERVEHVVPRNLFNINLLVKVFSIFDLFGGAGGAGGFPFGPSSGPISPIALLLLTQQGGPGGSPDLASLLLFSQAFGGGMPGGLAGAGASNPLLLWSLLQGGNSGTTDLSTLLLLSALSGSSGAFGGSAGAAAGLTVSPHSASLSKNNTQDFTSSEPDVTWVLEPDVGNVRKTGTNTAEYKPPDPIAQQQAVLLIAISKDKMRVGVATVNLHP